MFPQYSISTASLKVTQVGPSSSIDGARWCSTQALQDEDDGEIQQRTIISGRDDRVCTLNVTAPPGSSIHLQAASGVLQGTKFIVVERLGGSNTICESRYVVFKITKWTCPIVFAHGSLLVTFRTNVALHLTSRAEGESPGEFTCPEVAEVDAIGGDMSECDIVDGYRHIQQCAQHEENRNCSNNSSGENHNALCWSEDARCNFDIPTNYTGALGDRHVIFNCIHQKYPPQKHFVIFPANISHLNISANRIARIEPEAFRTMGSLVTALDLSWNDGLTLYPTIFQHLKNLKVLVLTGCGLQEMESVVLQSLPSLTDLWIDANNLSSIASDLFEGLGGLQTLYMSDNELVKIGSRTFQDLRNLQVLDVSNNHLEMLFSNTFVGSFKLKQLYLAGNHLSNIVTSMFEGLHNLRLLDLSGNDLVRLTTDVFANLRSLKELYLNDNRLGVLQVGVFDPLSGLTTLHLYNNYLPTLDVDLFNRLSHLETLQLQNIQLETLEEGVFLDLNNLLHLHLYRNKLSRLDAGMLKGLTNLNELLLYNNALKTLEVGAFKGMKNLTSLDLNNNILSALKVGIFTGLKNLSSLCLQNNMLQMLSEGVFKGLRKLESLQLNSNRITTVQIGTFSGLTQLKDLYLQNNRLVTLDADIFHGLNHLIELRLQRNRMERLETDLFDGLRNLDLLTLWGNKLGTLEGNIFNGLHRVTYLYLYKNKITALKIGAFNGLNQLTDLYISNNRLETIDNGVFANLTSLKYLSLASCGLASLPESIFRGLNSLLVLNLDNNTLSTVDQNMFDGSNTIQTLLLSNNKFKELDFALFKHFPHLSHLDLTNNDLGMLPALGRNANLSDLYIRGNRLARVKGSAFEGSPPDMNVSVDQPEICRCYLQHVNNCSAKDPLSEYITCSRLLTNRALLMFMWLLGFCAVFGNALVIYLRKRHFRDQNKVQALLLGNLAMSDLLMGMYMIIMASADVHYGEYFPMSAEIWRTGGLCKLAGTLCITSSEASVMFVTLISIDRFICIKYPYTTRKLHTKSTLKAAACVWVSAFMLGVIPSSLAGLNPDFYDNSHVCIGLPLVQQTIYTTQRKTEQKFNVWGKAVSGAKVQTTVAQGKAPGMFYSIALFLGFNLLCFLIIFATYAEIIRTVMRTTKEASRQRNMNEEVKLTAKVAAIVATDFFCWFPIIFTGILVQSGAVDVSPVFFAWVVTFILPINSAINPFLYTLADVIANRRQKKEGSSNATAMQTIQSKSV